MKDNFKQVNEIWKYFKKDRILVFITILFAFLSAVLLIAASITTGFSLNAFDLFIKNKNLLKENLYESMIYASITIFLYFLYWIAQSLVYRIVVWLSHKTGSQIRKEVFQNILQLSISYMDSKKTGEFISRTSNDVDQLIINLTESLATVTVTPFVIFISIIIMLLISPYLTIIYLLMLPLIVIGSLLISSKAAPHFSKQLENFSQLNGVGLEAIENKEAVYFFQNQKNIIKKYEELNFQYMDNVRKGEYKIRLVWPWVDIIENSIYGVIFIIGSILFGQNSGTALGFVTNIYNVINFGLIATIISFCRMINGEIGNFARQASLLQKMLSCAKRIFNIINESPEIDTGSLNPKDVSGEIEFKNVSFGYNPKNPVIKNLNLKIKKGTKVAIVGPTGCGKTTLLQLLLRFYDINDGKIKIDGIDIRKFTKESLSNLITIVFQDTHLFSISVNENIRYGTQKKISNESIKNAANVMNSLHFINIMPEGFETILREASNLSTGEAQLLALTRSYVNDSKILILDEATSSIDTKTEVEVQKGMLKLMKDKTSIVIAHRLSTIVNSDLIVVMNNGKIVEQGNHIELMKKKKFYYNLYNSKIKE